MKNSRKQQSRVVGLKPSCSCADWADMCKHVAAVLYPVGLRTGYISNVLTCGIFTSWPWARCQQRTR